MWAIRTYKNCDTNKIQGVILIDEGTLETISLTSKQLKGFMKDKPNIVENLRLDCNNNIQINKEFSDIKRKAYAQTFEKNMQINHYCVITGYRYNTVCFIADGIDENPIYGEYYTLGELAGRLGLNRIEDLKLFNAKIKLENNKPRIYIYNNGKITKLGEVRLDSVNNIFSPSWEVDIEDVTQEGIRLYSIEHKYGVGKAEIPNGVCHIEKFYGGVNNLILPCSVHSLGEGCFSDTDDLLSIKLDSGLAIIPKECFLESSIHSVQFSGNEVEILNSAFENCEKLMGIIYSNTYKVGNCTFKNTNIRGIHLERVNWIGTEAFMNCKRLEKIKLSNCLKHIGPRAFANCKALEKVTIPSTTEMIGKQAFRGCKNLKIVYVAHGTKIMQDAFDKHTKISYY